METIEQAVVLVHVTICDCLEELNLLQTGFFSKHMLFILYVFRNAVTVVFDYMLLIIFLLSYLCIDYILKEFKHVL